MKKIFLAIALFYMTGNLPAQTDPMQYFVGKWKFNVWFAGNEKTKPNLEATWLLEKSSAQHFEATGKVTELKRGETTKEWIGFDAGKKMYSRTITSAEGLFFFSTSGWVGNKLTWEGYMVPLSDQRLEMKEEITRISENEFHAVFYTRKNGQWEMSSREVLTRINS